MICLPTVQLFRPNYQSQMVIPVTVVVPLNPSLRLGNGIVDTVILRNAEYATFGKIQIKANPTSSQTTLGRHFKKVDACAETS